MLADDQELLWSDRWPAVWCGRESQAVTGIMLGPQQATDGDTSPLLRLLSAWLLSSADESNHELLERRRVRVRQDR